MKLIYPDKFQKLLGQIKLSFNPFESMDNEQLLELIDKVEDYLSFYGVDPSGKELNAIGMLCEDFLFWVAEQP